MALFNETLTDEVTGTVTARFEKYRNALERDSSDAEGKSGEKLALRNDMKILISVANGEVTRSNLQMTRVELALKRVLDLLFGNSVNDGLAMTEEFWQTDIGIVVSRARWWISMDELITISNAAALAFGENNQANRMRIARAMDKGLLDWVPDPSVANPQQNRRVLREQVERLRDLRSLPE